MNAFDWIFMTCLIQHASSIGILELKLKSFTNPSHQLEIGGCCDSILMCSREGCDNYFKKICLTAPNGTTCNIGETSTDVFKGNPDNITFDKNIGSVSNPILYSVGKWEGFFKLEIEIWDRDTEAWRGPDDLVLRGEEIVSLSASSERHLSPSRKGQLQNRFSTLVYEVRVYCDKGYLIPSCEEHCAVTNDSRGHYDCDFANGKKACLDGWHGDDCNEYCLPRDDDGGHYTCDNKTGKITCLPGWQNEGSNCTEGSTLHTFVYQSVVTSSPSPCFMLKSNPPDGLPATFLSSHAPSTTNKHLQLLTNSQSNSIPDATRISTVKLETTLSNYRAITSFLNAEESNTFRNYKLGTSVGAKMETTDILYKLLTNSVTSIEATSTGEAVKATMYNSNMDAASQSYKQRAEGSSSYILETVHNRKSSYSSSISISKTARFHESQIIAASQISRKTPHQSSLWVMNTNRFSAVSTEALQIIQVTDSPGTERASIIAVSQSVDTRFAMTTAFKTANSNRDWMSKASTNYFQYSDMISSSRAVEYSPQSSFYGYHVMLEEFKWKMWIELDGKQWFKGAKRLFKKEICRSILNMCRYDFGCNYKSKRQNSKRPEFNFRRNAKRQLMVLLMKLTAAVKTGERKDAKRCLYRAILDASRRIEGLMQVRIISVIAITNEGEEPKGSDNPKLRKHDHENIDLNKIIIAVVIGLALLLSMVVILAIYRSRKQRLVHTIQHSRRVVARGPLNCRQVNERKEPETRERQITGDKRIEGAREDTNLRQQNKSDNHQNQTLLKTNDTYLETIFL